MNKLVLIAALLLGGCAYDRGKCLQSVIIHRSEYTYTTIIPIGKIMMPMTRTVPAHDETICAQWEYPNGKTLW